VGSDRLGGRLSGSRCDGRLHRSRYDPSLRDCSTVLRRVALATACLITRQNAAPFQRVYVRFSHYRCSPRQCAGAMGRASSRVVAFATSRCLCQGEAYLAGWRNARRTVSGHSAACAAGELPCRARLAFHDRSDLLERIISWFQREDCAVAFDRYVTHPPENAPSLLDCPRQAIPVYAPNR
jgi:hypothetical protein